MSTNVIERATRNGLLFASAKGNVNVIDLWQMPLESNRTSSLDSLWAHCSKEVESAGSAGSFVNKGRTVDPTKQLRVDVLEHIITVRQTENANKLAAKDLAAKKTRLINLLADKQLQAEGELSEDDIKAQLAAL